jgi:hypothetical protein
MLEISITIMLAARRPSPSLTILCLKDLHEFLSSHLTSQLADVLRCIGRWLMGSIVRQSSAKFGS